MQVKRCRTHLIPPFVVCYRTILIRHCGFAKRHWAAILSMATVTPRLRSRYTTVHAGIVGTIATAAPSRRGNARLVTSSFR